METLYTLPEFTKQGLATTYEWLYSVAKVQLRAPGLGTLAQDGHFATKLGKLFGPHRVLFQAGLGQAARTKHC